MILHNIVTGARWRYHSIYKVILAICAATISAVSTSQAASSETVLSTWLTDQVATVAAPPGESKALEEADSLQQRVNSLSEDDRRNVLHWTRSSPSHRWAMILMEEIDRGPPSPEKSRSLALLNIAIYDAIVSAHQAKRQFDRPRPSLIEPLTGMAGGTSYPSAHAAAASAASEVLTYLYPDNADRYVREASNASRARVDAGLNYPSDIDAGVQIGRDVATQVIQWAKNDNSDTPFTGERPIGPGVLQGKLFVYPNAGEWRTFAVKSAEAFLPPPPPAHDSKQMEKELSELKALDRTLPQQMLAWTQHSTRQAYRWWYEQIGMALFERDAHRDALGSAHVYATYASLSHDAIIACFKAKYTYWQIRPSQLDSELTTLFPNPPHPSYPSAHSCASTTGGIVSSHFFPEKAPMFMAAAEAGGLSRLYAGIHYASDDLAGDTIGEQVAKEGLTFSANLK